MATGHGSKLPRKKELAIHALLSLPTIRAAAAAVGVDESTLRAWMKQDEFKSAYDAARRQLVDGVLTELQKAGAQAVATLVSHLESVDGSVAVRSANNILTQLAKYTDATELAEQLKAIQEQLEALRHGGIDGEQAPGEPVAAGRGRPAAEDAPGPAAADG